MPGTRRIHRMLLGPRTGVANICESPSGYWELNQVPPEEHSVLLMVQPSLQYSVIFLNTYKQSHFCKHSAFKFIWYKWQSSFQSHLFPYRVSSTKIMSYMLCHMCAICKHRVALGFLKKTDISHRCSVCWYLWQVEVMFYKIK